MSMPVALLVLVFIASPCLWSISNATPEGAALQALLAGWQSVSFPSWVGEDPCGGNVTVWENVTCSGGHVIALNVSNRGITGRLDGRIGDLVYLQVLDVSNSGDSDYASLPQNLFSGGIPDSLFNLTALTTLNLSTIAWNTSFPDQLVKLVNLQQLELSEGNFAGEVSDDFFSALTNLRVLYIGSNKLTMALANFEKLTQLQELSLFDIALNTVIPPDMAVKLPNLTILNLHTCSLYGGLPDSFGNLKSLQRLELYQNQLSGFLPKAWNGLQNLTELRLSDNYVSGPFPTWLLTDMPRLSQLYLDDNFFWNDTPSQVDLNKFSLIRIDCNYLNGTDPHAGQDTSSTQNKTRYNCFKDATVSNWNKVISQCKSHTSADISCDEFYEEIVNAARLQCAPCPPGQNVLPNNTAANPCVCGFTASKHSGDGVPIGAVIGGVLGLFVVFAVILAFVIWKRRAHFSFLDKFRAPKEELGDWEAPPGVQRFTLEELSRITENFSDSHVLGAGGFGKVFLGTLDDGRMVAIKRASPDRVHGIGEFRNEVMLLSRLHHRHLVKLEGFCEEGGLEILVYEYMINGNLHAHLLGKVTSTPLHWYKRLEIAVGVAQGLEYLHSFADPPVIHRDVKPSNILLDDNMVAKLADFGISKVTADTETHVSTRPAGTAGYLDPEYFLRRQLTTASDVYAYGVVLLELVTGQEAIDHKRVEEYNLVAWTQKRFKTAGIVSIIDPLIDEEYPREVFSAMADLGLQCASFDKNERPSMKVVLSTLEPELVTYSQYLVSSRSQAGKRSKSRKAERSLAGLDQTSSPDSTQRSTATDPDAEITVGLLARHMGPR